MAVKPTIRRGQSIIHFYDVASTVSGSWGKFYSYDVSGSIATGIEYTHEINLQAVSRSASVNGSFMQLRDCYGTVVYQKIFTGGNPIVLTIDPMLTISGPIEYFDSEGSKQLRLFGSFI